MGPRLRKLALSAHLTFSVGWIGAVLAYIALGIAAVTTDEISTIRAAWGAMELIGWAVIVPLAVASLITGVLMALGTKWGLFRHYWVVISFTLTVLCVAVLLLHMPSVSITAAMVQQAGRAELLSVGGDLEHPSIGLALLLVVQVLNLYKPKGLTRYGRRRRRAERSGAEPVKES
jgi:hypothetical protein